MMQNARDQLDRLVQELADLEDCREDLEDDEYEESKRDAMEQLAEFETSLSKLASGDMGLLDEMGVMRTAIRAAISQAFKTPEVIQMFASRRPDDLRQKLTEVERDLKVGKVDVATGNATKCEILSALAKLNETLSEEEKNFIAAHDRSIDMKMVELDRDSNKLNDASKIIAMAKTL